MAMGRTTEKPYGTGTPLRSVLLAGGFLFLLPTGLAEHQKLTDEVVEDDDQHGGHQLEEVLVQSQPGAEHGHDDLLQDQGQHTAAREGGDLANDGDKAAALALKDPNAVGHVGEGDGGHPGDDVGTVQEDRGGINGVSPQVVEEEGYRPIHYRGQTAEDDVQDDALVFFQKFQHNVRGCPLVDLVGGALGGVDEGYALGGQLVADAVGLGEVPLLLGGLAGVDGGQEDRKSVV